MRRIALLLLFPLLTGQASATGSIGCQGIGGDDVSVELTLGSLPVLAIVAASITVGEETWSTADDSAARLAVGQAFSEEGRILVDFVDPNFESVLVRLRLVSADEGKDQATAGTVAVAGQGVWPVSCVGP